MLLLVMAPVVKWEPVCPPGTSSRHRNSCSSEQHIPHTQTHVFSWLHASKAGLEHEPRCLSGRSPLNWFSTNWFGGWTRWSKRSLPTLQFCDSVIPVCHTGRMLSARGKDPHMWLLPSRKCRAKLEKLMWVKNKPALYSSNLLLGNPWVTSAPPQECQILPCWHNNTGTVPEG